MLKCYFKDIYPFKFFYLHQFYLFHIEVCFYHLEIVDDKIYDGAETGKQSKKRVRNEANKIFFVHG